MKIEKKFRKPKVNKHSSKITSLVPHTGIFMTGIENSDPVVEGVRRDQLKEAYDFYENYELRLERIASLGIRWIRFGPRYSAVHTNEHEFDFAFSDKVVEKSKQLDLTIVADLLHFGLPEWLHEQEGDEPYFQNNQFPKKFAHYARVFAERYPHIQSMNLL